MSAKILSDAVGGRTKETVALARHVRDLIRVTGPISIAQFQRWALTSAIGGYYTTKGEHVFGAKGDFVTAPDISPLFGEMCGWHRSRGRVNLVELGPGRGSLMRDVLRVFSHSGALKSVGNLYLVEASEPLRKKQEAAIESVLKAAAPKGAASSLNLQWFDRIDDVPDDQGPCLFYANEFFDALPVFQFRLTEQKQWREVLVGFVPNEAPNSTEKEGKSTDAELKSNNDILGGKFKFVLAPAATSGSENLTLPRFDPKNFKVGDQIEVSPQCWSIARELADRIRFAGGSALIIDYGQDWMVPNSLRSIRNHKINPSIFENIGESDITFDVDFSLLRDAIDGVATCSPVQSQGEFLERMGIKIRMNHLLKRMEEQKRPQHEKEALLSGVDRVTNMGINGMGKLYKVLEVRRTPLGIQEKTSENSSR